MVLEYNFKRIIKIAIKGEEEEAKKMVIPGSLPFRAPNPDVSLDNTYTRRDQDWELYNTVDKTMRLHNLKDSIEEAKNELKDNKYIYTSRPYTLLNDQLPYWKSEVEHFRVVIDSLQVDRFAVM